MLTILLVLVACVVGLLLLFTFWQMGRLPRNRPDEYQTDADKKVVVLAGDSITHGQIGENYVSLLATRLDMQQFSLVNAGINSHLAWNLLQRLDEIINCNPDFVTILIGTNDANAVTTEKEGKEYTKRMELPRIPDQKWYQESLHKIVTILQEKTQAKIALISIPPIGEDPNHFAFKISQYYLNSIKDVAESTGVTYLPFQEMMVEYLKKHPGNPTYPIEKAIRGMTIARKAFVFWRRVPVLKFAPRAICASLIFSIS